MNWAQKAITGLFLSAALLAPTIASAVPLRVYEQAASDPVKQTQIFKDAYSTAVARTLTGLRDEHFKDGRQKTPQRIDRDKRLADIIEGMVGHLTDEQSGALVLLIDQYAKVQPDTELEDVITSFLLTEAMKQLNNPSPGSSPTAP